MRKRHRLRVAFERSGSPGWIMRLIEEYALDRRHGFDLEVVWLDDRMRRRLQSTEAALFERHADLIDTDWLSMLRHRREGRPVRAIFPYGRIVGGLIVPGHSSAETLNDLAGRRIGVVHGSDKNWLIARTCLDPSLEPPELIETGSKSTLRQRLIEGALDAALLYWHQLPGMLENGDFRLLRDVLDLVRTLTREAPPTTFFVVLDEFAQTNPAVCHRFCAAYREAVEALRGDEALWQSINQNHLGELSPAGLSSLRRHWSARVCDHWDQTTLVDLRRFSDRLIACGGERRVADREFDDLFDTRFFHSAVQPGRANVAGAQ